MSPPNADTARQGSRARDSFDLVRRLGDVVIKKQAGKRKEVSEQVEELLGKLAKDSKELSDQVSQQAKELHAEHTAAVSRLVAELVGLVQEVLAAQEALVDNFATAEATVLAAGGPEFAFPASKCNMPEDLLIVSVEDLLRRAQALCAEDAKLIKEGGMVYADLEE